MKLHDHFIVAVLLCWVTQDFELYAAFDPLADKVLFTLMSPRFFLSVCFIQTMHILDLFYHPNTVLSMDG
jgi:hypothetical protein